MNIETIKAQSTASALLTVSESIRAEIAAAGGELFEGIARDDGRFVWAIFGNDMNFADAKSLNGMPAEVAALACSRQIEGVWARRMHS